VKEVAAGSNPSVTWLRSLPTEGGQLAEQACCQRLSCAMSCWCVFEAPHAKTISSPSKLVVCRTRFLVRRPEGGQ
jgi:hypothetical protein